MLKFNLGGWAGIKYELCQFINSELTRRLVEKLSPLEKIGEIKLRHRQVACLMNYFENKGDIDLNGISIDDIIKNAKSGLDAKQFVRLANFFRFVTKLKGILNELGEEFTKIREGLYDLTEFRCEIEYYILPDGKFNESIEPFCTINENITKSVSYTHLTLPTKA